MSLRRDDTIELQKMLQAENLADKEYLRKFRMFFTGLIFAIISFIGSHPISTSNCYLKIIEITALTSLLIAGFLLLAKLSGVYIKGTYNELQTKWHKFLYFIFNINMHYWIFFIIGMILILIDRSIALFNPTSAPQ